MLTENDFYIVHGYRHYIRERKTGRAVASCASRVGAYAWIKDRVREYNGPVYDAAFAQLRIALVFAIGFNLGRYRLHPPCFGDLWVPPAKED